MGTKMGFPPGVRIQLKDNSAYTVVDNPYTTAGIVGYASKGELNKIIQVNTTAELDSKLGYGYQSYKYNQGMYAARAVLDAGGVVEFVRPYGEEIDRTDPYRRDLKTDAFVVTYDKSDKDNSLNVKHFAATRYKTDGAAKYGLVRKINNIAEAVTSGKNVDFGLTASDDYVGRSDKDMVMFAVVNRDPSYAYRAYDRFDVVQSNPLGNSEYSVVLSTTPTFNVGDTVIIPKHKSGEVDTTGTITRIVDKTVYLTVNTTAKISIDTIIFAEDSESAIVDGFDYMSIKTAVAGRNVKKFSAIKWGITNGDGAPVSLDTITSGDVFSFNDKMGNCVDVRLLKTSDVTVTSVSDNRLKLEGVTFEDGDEIALMVTTASTPASTVTYRDLEVTIDSLNVATVPKPTGYTQQAGDTVKVSITSPVENVLYTDITGAKTWAEVADAVVKVLTSSSVGFAKNAVVNDINGIVADGVSGITNNILVDTSSVFDYSVGDKVIIVRASNTYDATATDANEASNEYFNGASVIGGILTITDINTFTGIIKVDAATSLPTVANVTYQLLNLSTTSKTVYNAVTKELTYDVSTGNTTLTIAKGTTSVTADIGAMPDTADHRTYVITSVKRNGESVEVPVDIKFSNTYSTITATISSTDVDNTYDTVIGLTVKTLTEKVIDTVDTYLISSYSMYVSEEEQTKNLIVTNEKLNTYATVDAKWNIEIEKSKKVLADSEIGATFLGLGFAKTDYIDINYDNNPQQVYVLTDEGASIARMYLSIRYRFNGKIYEFEGTIVPYSTSTKIQLGIQYAADYELTDSGLEFVLNDSGILDYFLENDSYDLSQTVVNGVLNGSVITPAFNADDPAIINDAVWTYSPLNNRSGSTLSTVWNLFLNKDGSDVDMLVAAGMAINNPFMNKLETLNTQVMQAMLNVCEARKDCFALFDGVSEPDIAKALKKEIAATGFVSTIGRWGMLYDGRGLVQDSIYTNGEAEIMKSIQMANIITGNRQSGIYWEPPSGYDKAPIPSAWGTKEKFTRTYSAEDKNCDVAKLNDIHVNATRVNREGMCIWGDFTLQMEDTAFNQAHVAMLVAGIHKTFYKYLDHKVFRLNTTNLRAQITSDLQDKLNMIKRANPQGLIDGIVICNDTNNTPELIDQNFLIVDVKLWPTKSARWIILRTSVESTQNGNNISTEIISG